MATRNIFALLAAEEDGVIKKIPQTKPSAPAQPAKAAAPAAQPAKTAPAAAAPAKSAAPQQNKAAAPAAAADGSAQKPRDSRPRSDRPPRTEGDKPAGERPPRGPRPEGDRPPRPPRAEGDRPPRPPRAEGDKPAGAEGAERPPRAPRAEGDRPPRPPRAEGDRPPRPPRAEGEGADGAPRQRYNKDDPNPRGKRNFDRRSGDHKVLSESKKGGAGGHSWGVLGEEGTKEPKHISKNETVDDSAPTADPVAEETPAAAAPEVEEPKVFTLEEIMKMQKEKAVAVDKKIRKAGEGVEETWTDAVLVNRVELPEYLPKKEEEKGKEAKKETKAAPAKAVRADDLIKIVVPERPRESDSRERRPRNFDGPRQDRPRGGPKGGKAAAPAAPALDESAFPSLKTVAKAAAK